MERAAPTGFFRLLSMWMVCALGAGHWHSASAVVVGSAAGCQCWLLLLLCTDALPGFYSVSIYLGVDGDRGAHPPPQDTPGKVRFPP